MKRLFILAVALAIAVGCGSSKTPTSASTANQVKFLATLSPANEVPAITNAEASGTGNATITFNLTRDGAGAITTATADFLVTLSNFPPNTTLTAAHIHPGAAGVNGSALVSLGLGSGEIVLANGTGTFTKPGITSNMTPANAQDIINNPSQYYFNVHSTLNGGGFARGQLVKQ